MLLKAATTCLLVIGLVCLLLGPVLLGRRPTERRALAIYSVRFSAYLTLTTTCFLGAAIGSVMLVRRARERYRAEVRENLDDLIEGALNAHRTQPTAKHDSST